MGAIWMLFQLNKELTASQQLLDDHLPSYSVKAEYELARLVSALNEFMVGTATREEVQLRYDILLARVNHYESSFISNNQKPNEEVRILIERILGLMLKYEEPLFSLQHDDIQKASVVEGIFQSMYKPFEELTTLNRETHNRLLKNLDDDIASRVRIGFVLIGASILISVLTLTIFWYNLKEKTRFNSDLELQIHARTKDLRISNASLKREMVERQRAEKTLAEREQQIHSAQKMEAIGRITSGVAHDFNNLLAVIMGNIELIKGSKNRNLSSKYLESALAATVMGSQLTRKLLAFGRRSPLKPEIVDVNRVILEIDDLLMHTLTENISLDMSLSDDIWPISVDRSLLENVMLNLVINARDALKDGGRILITTKNSNVPSTDSQDTDPGGNRLNGYVLVSITDKGEGMTPQVLDQVFEPFFSTKSESQGSGLGLSMASGFIQQSNGKIEVTSAPGKGTCVQLLLPRCFSNVVTIPGKNGETYQATGGTRKILVVDDSEAVRQVVVEQLMVLGYETIEATSGTEALELVNSDSSVDVLLSDVVMPGELQGLELADRVKKMRPDMKIIIMSGYPKGSEHGDYEENSCFTKLMKPVSLAQLSSALREEFEEDESANNSVEKEFENVY
ncbi:MAG: ATP-binding protein [Granulosicoccus sp.]